MPTLAVAGASGVAAAFAPAVLTGTPVVDAVERAVVVAAIAFVGAHAHRWTWLAAGVLVAVYARGPSLLFLLAGLALAAYGNRLSRRPKEIGAASVGLVLNAALWYPASHPSLIPQALVAGAVILLVGSGLPQLRRRPRRIATSVLGGAVALLVVAVGLAGWVALQARSDVEAGTTSARSALAAVRRGDSEAARTHLADARAQLADADRTLGGVALEPIGLVPGAAQQAHAVQVSVRTARSVTRAADALLVTDYEDLRYDGRIDVAAITGLQTQAAEVRDVLRRAEADLADLDGLALLPPLRSRVDDFAAELGTAREDADLASELVDVTPGLLGADGDRRYLVAFLTPAELRGAGGFIGNWVEIEAVDGDVRLSRSGRIEELIAAAPPGQRTLDGPDDYVARYRRFRPTDNLQDTTLSPNWPSDASVLSQLYPQSGGRPVDGVFAVDPSGLAALLELAGPVTVEGLATPLDATNVVDFLTRDQYLLFPDRDARAAVLDTVIRTSFERITDASLPAPRRLGDVLGPATRARHLQLWSPDEAEQHLFRRLDADGRVAIPKGVDGFSVVQQNAGNNKIDAYLQREVSYEAEVDVARARVDGTITVTLRNEVPSLALGPAVIGNARGLPIGTNLTSLSLYTRLDVTGAAIDGRPVQLAPDEELGLQVWDTALLTIPPGGAVTVTYEVTGPLDLRTGYEFRYLPQPVANPDRLTTTITARGGAFTGPGSPAPRSAAVDADEPVITRSGVRPER